MIIINEELPRHPQKKKKIIKKNHNIILKKIKEPGSHITSSLITSLDSSLSMQDWKMFVWELSFITL